MTRLRLPESRAVVTELDDIGNLVLHHYRTYGYPVGERLGHRDNIGMAVLRKPRMGPQLSCPRKTALDRRRNQLYY